MSAEEAEKTTAATTDVSAGDEEEEWLYGGKKGAEVLPVRKPYYTFAKLASSPAS